MWIKVCGMTTPAAIEAALAARVDAVGFVFSPSVRRLAVSDAARLARPARARMPCIAVTRHPSQQLLDDILAVFRPDVWQSDAADIAALRVPAGLAVLPVLRAPPRGRDAPAREPLSEPLLDSPPDSMPDPLPDSLPDPLPARVLYEGPRSGAGVACDWIGARAVARRTELILAGGLDETNVAAAIESVEPFGVDVSSGVEAAPGIKSPERILRFVAAARNAAEEAMR